MKKQSTKRWLAVSTLIVGLSTGSMLYADDDAASSCSADGIDDACCSATITTLCKIDTDLTAGFNDVTNLITKTFVATQDFLDKFLGGLIAGSALSSAYIDNDNISAQTSALTNNNMTAVMRATPAMQLNIMQSYVDKLPVNAMGDFDVNNFSLSGLMNNPGLSTDEQATAKQMIENVAGLANPVKRLDKKYADQSSKVPIKEFLGSLTAYSAAQSNGLNALYRILQERSVQPGIDSSVLSILNIPTGTRLSPWQLDEFNVYQALNMAKTGALTDASANDIARATYYVQALNLYETFKNRQELQQLNATMAVIQLQLLNSIDKESLNTMRSRAIQ